MQFVSQLVILVSAFLGFKAMRSLVFAVFFATIVAVPAKAGEPASALCYLRFQDVKSLVEDTTTKMEELGLDARGFKQLLAKMWLEDLLALDPKNSGIDFSKPVCVLFPAGVEPWVVVSVTSKTNALKAFRTIWGEDAKKRNEKGSTAHEFPKKSKKILIEKGHAYILEADASAEKALSYSLPDLKALAQENDAQVWFSFETSDLSKIVRRDDARKVIETVFRAVTGVVSWKRGQVEIKANVGVLPQVAKVFQYRESKSNIAQILGILPQTSTGFLALFLPLDAIVEALKPLLGKDSWVIGLLESLGNDVVLFEEGGIASLGVVLRVKDSDSVVKGFEKMCNALSNRCSFASKKENSGFELVFGIGGLLNIPVLGKFFGDYLVLSFLDKQGLREHGESLFLRNGFVRNAITKEFVSVGYGTWGDYLSSIVPYLAVARHRFSEKTIAYAGLADALLLLHDLMLDLGFVVSMSRDSIEIEALSTLIRLDGSDGATRFQDALRARFSGNQQAYKDLLLEVSTKGEEPFSSRAKQMLTSPDLLGDIFGAALFAALFGAKSSSNSEDSEVGYATPCQELVAKKCLQGAQESKQCQQAIQLLEEVENRGSKEALQKCVELLEMK